jgi:hypothetical protein
LNTLLEKSTTHPSFDQPRHPTLARRGLVVVFASTFLELIGVFMLNPLLLITLKAQGLSTAMARVGAGVCCEFCGSKVFNKFQI